MPVFAGQGDPVRSMALLWRVPAVRTGPGPKPGLSVDAIVAAAVTVADADGLDARIHAVAATASGSPLPKERHAVGRDFDRGRRRS